MSPSLSLLHQGEKVVNHGGATPIGPSDANETETATGRRIEKKHHHNGTEKRKKTKVLPACKKKRIAKHGFRDPSDRGPGDTTGLRPMSGKDPAKGPGGQPRGGIDPGGSGGSSVPTADDRRPPPPAVAGPTEVSPSRAQTDIRKLLDALSEYAYDTNNVADDDNPTASGSGGSGDHSKSSSKIRAISDDYTGPDAAGAALPPLLAQIPNTLVGFVGTHCEVDVAAVSQAAEGILEFSSSEDYDNNPRSRLLRNEFHRVLRSGGTAMVLQAIARMMNRHGTSMTMSTTMTTTTTMTTMSTTTIATAGDPPPDDNAGRPEHEAAFEAVFRCWGVVRVGIVSGLSTNTLVLVVRSCVHGMNELEKVWNETSAASTRGGGGGGGTRDGGGGKLLFDTLGRLLEILLQAIASPRMTADALFYDQTSILASLLALLGQACCCSDGDDDPSAEAAIIGLIEDLLGILVVCARKGLIQGHDFQRLVPACQASLSRFQLATAGSDSGCGEEAPSAAAGSDDDGGCGIGIGKTIVVRVVELIELEDKTVGLWLRHTYGITAPPPPSGDQQRRRQQQQQAEGGGVDLSWRSAAEAAYERAASTFGGGRQQRRRTKRTDDDDDNNPSPPQQRELFPSIAVGPPDRLDRENDDDDDDCDY